MTRYEEQRNKLIKTAVKFANRKVPPNVPTRVIGAGRTAQSWTEEHSLRWNAVYHDEMNRLWANRG